MGAQDGEFEEDSKELKHEDTLSQCAEALDAAKVSFSEDNIAMQLAWQRFDEAHQKNVAHQKKAREESGLVSAIQVALRDHYPPVLAGDKDNTRHLEVLLPLIKKLPLDESLSRAFPVAAAKPPDDRGAFDRQAVRAMH